jgi:uncharacterized membrane protein (GlpM family)
MPDSMPVLCERNKGAVMEFLVKLIITNAIIIASVRIGREFPPLAGLIATMPLTSLLVLVWLQSDHPADYQLLTDYSRGVLWGIIPTVLFFAAVWFGFRRQWPFSVVLTAGGGVWLAGAVVHRWLVH